MSPRAFIPWRYEAAPSTSTRQICAHCAITPHMTLLKLKTGAPSPVTPVEFFTSICPKVLALSDGICRKLGGRYAFQLFGEGGGSWTLDYNDVVVADGVLDNDLYVEMEAADFTDLLKGTLDVEAAAQQGRLRASGDVALFSNLVVVLQPASGASGGAQ